MGVRTSVAACAVVSLSVATTAQPRSAGEHTTAARAGATARPTPGLFRWQEDWAMLADRTQRTEPGDGLKYIPLSAVDADRYLSLGVTLRERFEYRDALFGTQGHSEDSYLLHRLELHADAHLTDGVRAFVQLEDALAPGRAHPGPADANQADLRLAFVDLSTPVPGGRWTVRVGRQEVAFDLQRFASVRDGANVRQALDAVWMEYDLGEAAVSVLLSRPVQYRNDSAFDDLSNRHFTFGGVRAERRVHRHGQVSATFSVFRRDDARFLAGSGHERRRSLDVHYDGIASGFDWDVEGIAQQGYISGKRISAWAAGSILGYTFTTSRLRPRLGVQLDAASGDRDLSDERIETFNPLFPNGYYVTLSGYTGYSNFIHFKQSLSLTPAPRIKVLLGLGELWRESVDDAVYATPVTPVPGTAGERGKYAGTYYQARLDWAASRSFTAALEANYYDLAAFVHRAGGRDSRYLAIEARWAW